MNIILSILAYMRKTSNWHGTCIVPVTTERRSKMDTTTKAKELNEVSGIIALLKTFKANPTMNAVLAKTPVNAAEMLDFQIDTLELFMSVGGMLVIAEKEIAELKQRLQAVETRTLGNVLVGAQ